MAGSYISLAILLRYSFASSLESYPSLILNILLWSSGSKIVQGQTVAISIFCFAQTLIK